MLAFVGFIAGDLTPLPGVTLSSVAAHDANLGGYGGAMGQIFWWIGLVQILGSIPASSARQLCGRLQSNARWSCRRHRESGTAQRGWRV